MRKFAVVLAFALGTSILSFAPAGAAVKLHGLFTDNMVLQQGMKVPVWGTADDGEKVTVECQKQKVSTEAKDGKWMVYLNDLKAGGPFELTVTGSNTITLKNVMVGEVWIASGQSNMEWSTAQISAKKDVANSENPMIRLFRTPKTPAQRPQTELGKGNPQWQECGPDSVGPFSAVGYYFARDLQKARNVPVGIIQSAWGGTPAEHWTSQEVLQKLNIKGNSQLYNGMIKPLQPFAFRGVIWYQGESNAARGKDYLRLFSAMIRNWRDDWKQGDFPFLFVQLAPWNVPKDADSWPIVREAQWLTSKQVPNTAMAVITDHGHPTDIHPKAKEPVGARLALAARATAYGEKLVYSGPEYKSMKVSGNQAILSFDHIGGGLMAKGEKLKGFTIAGKDGKFHPANAEIKGDTVVVFSADVEQPTAVRYGWANYPQVNLYNREGLPATPFRTDMPKNDE